WVATQCGNSEAAAKPDDFSGRHKRPGGVRGCSLTPLVPRAYITPASATSKIGAGWQSGYATDCKSVYSGSIPLPASNPIASPSSGSALNCRRPALGGGSSTGGGRPGCSRRGIGMGGGGSVIGGGMVGSAGGTGGIPGGGVGWGP